MRRERALAYSFTHQVGYDVNCSVLIFSCIPIEASFVAQLDIPLSCLHLALLCPLFISQVLHSNLLKLMCFYCY